MGMDLYKYMVTKSTDVFEIGTTEIKIPNIECIGYQVPDSTHVNKCLEQVHSKLGIEYQESFGKYCYDFTNNNSYVAVYTDATVTEVKRLDKLLDDAYYSSDSDKIDAALLEFNNYGDKISKDESYWSEVIEFEPIKNVTEYKLMCSREEINYARKPFRDISDENIGIYRFMMKTLKGDYDNSFVIVDKETEDIFHDLIVLVECKDTQRHLLSILPLQDNEILCIDW